MKSKNKNKKLLNMTIVVMAIFLTAGSASAAISYVKITDDADSGISNANLYTHALDFGNSAAATVNGVVFAKDIGIAAGAQSNLGTRSYGPNGHYGNTPPEVTGDVVSVFNDFRFNPEDPNTIELTGLTPGKSYDLRLYDRAFGYQGGVRTYYISYDVGSDGSVEYTTPKIDQNDATQTPPGLSDDVSWATSYTYQADATGKIKVTIILANDAEGTYHLYGLTNENTDPSAAGAPTVTALTPTDDSSVVKWDDDDNGLSDDLVVLFNEPIAKGTGNITIKNLTDISQIVIPVGDAQVTVDGVALTINPTADLIVDKDYAIQIDSGAIEDADESNAYAGISDDTTWNFTTYEVVGDPKVLVYEPWDYPFYDPCESATIGLITESAPLPVNADTGLTGNWEVVGGDGDGPIIEEGSMGYGRSLPTAGGKWNDGAGVWQQWQLEAGIAPGVMDGHLDDGDELWFSFVCSIPIGQSTAYNEHELRIGDGSNYISIYPRKTGSGGGGEGMPINLHAVIYADGIENIGPTSVDITTDKHLYVGRVIFGATDDTMETYVPATDLALPASPTSTIVADVNQIDFDRIRAIIWNGNSMSQDEIRIGTTYASVIGYPLSPDVDGGDNWSSWSGETIKLNGSAANNDPVTLNPLEHVWTHDAPAGWTVDISDANLLDPDVTITKTNLDDPNIAVVTLKLTATSVGGAAPYVVPMKANMRITVYNTRCDAAIIGAGVEPDETDFNEDCLSNLGDAALFTEKWFTTYELQEPAIKPVE